MSLKNNIKNVDSYDIEQIISDLGFDYEDVFGGYEEFLTEIELIIKDYPK
jgi:hypothetical protein